MNLIDDAWISIVRKDGRKEKIAPWQIAEQENPVTAINAPRPDFQGALYQFLIGLLQTAFAPEDHDQWLEYWEEMPDEDEIRKRFSALSSAFILDNPDGPAFMQDFKLEKGEKKSISTLFIEAPGGKTLKDNLDHFVKREFVSRLCLPCCAMALFTLQTNAPSGGVGHRVSLRGGGPLTTLVLPTAELPVWNQLWLNVLDQDTFGSDSNTWDAHVFPWLASTRVSGKEGADTRPEDTHPLQMYWGMPRRIRFLAHGKSNGCDLCGNENGHVVEEYVTQNYGVNYVGEWVHPLTPYRFDKKKENFPLPVKGRQGGLGYRDWIGLVLNDSSSGSVARVTREYMEKRAWEIDGDRLARLWCFGYDMDNMKARCWYDQTLPLLRLDREQRENMLEWVGELIDAAAEAVGILSKQLKAAWFRRPGDVKDGNMSMLKTVVLEFWQKSELDFYNHLEQLALVPGDQRRAPPETYAGWLNMIRSLAYNLFDNWALEAPVEDLDMKRVISARNGLGRILNTRKIIKAMADKAKPHKEAP